MQFLPFAAVVGEIKPHQDQGRNFQHQFDRPGVVIIGCITQQCLLYPGYVSCFIPAVEISTLLGNLHLVLAAYPSYTGQQQIEKDQQTDEQQERSLSLFTWPRNICLLRVHL